MLAHFLVLLHAGILDQLLPTGKVCPGEVAERGWLHRQVLIAHHSLERYLLVRAAHDRQCFGMDAPKQLRKTERGNVKPMSLCGGPGGAGEESQPCPEIFWRHAHNSAEARAEGTD